MCNSCALCVCCFADDEKSHWNGTFFREIECSERSLSRSSCTGMRLHGDPDIHHCQTPQDVFLLDDCRLSLLLNRAERPRRWPVTKASECLRSFSRVNITHLLTYKIEKKKNVSCVLSLHLVYANTCKKNWTMQLSGSLTTPKSTISLWSWV